MLTTSSWLGENAITPESDGMSIWYRIHAPGHKAASGQTIGVKGLVHIVLRRSRASSRFHLKLLLVSVIKISVCL